MIKHEEMTKALQRWGSCGNTGSLTDTLEATYQIVSLLHDKEFEDIYLIGPTIADTIVGEVQEVLEYSGATGAEVYEATRPLIHLIERLMSKAEADSMNRLKKAAEGLRSPIMIGTRVFCTFSEARGELGTVKDFDADSRRVDVLLDSGTRTSLCPITMFALPAEE